MMHANRRWHLADVESADALAKMLTERTWTLCSAFSIQGHEEYLFLNDATHEDGAGEWAVCKRLRDGTYMQIESITFSWCNATEALAYVEDALAGKFDVSDFLVRQVIPRIDAPGMHRDCLLCA
jgi:hypothetical protein